MGIRFIFIFLISICVRIYLCSVVCMISYRYKYIAMMCICIYMIVYDMYVHDILRLLTIHHIYRSKSHFYQLLCPGPAVLFAICQQAKEIIIDKR